MAGGTGWIGLGQSKEKSMFYVYVLKSLIKDRYYTGQTNDLKQRLAEHNSGNVYSTKNLKPLKLVYFEKLENRSESVKREKYLKSAAGRKYLRKINADMAKLVDAQA